MKSTRGFFETYDAYLTLTRYVIKMENMSNPTNGLKESVSFLQGSSRPERVTFVVTIAGKKTWPPHLTFCFCQTGWVL